MSVQIGTGTGSARDTRHTAHVRWRGLFAATLMAALGIRSAGAGDQISEAENALFLADHFRSVRASTVLRYEFTKRGSMEDGFADTVEISVQQAKGAKVKTVSTRCLSGAKKIELPAVERAEGNPVVLCFLERDIREMERLTGGKSNYFRKRIRLALADSAEVKPVTIPFGGQQLDARQIRIAPYADDPMRERYRGYADKYYVFTLSEKIPGGVYEIDAVIPAPATGGKATDDKAPPLIEEVLILKSGKTTEKKF